MLTKERPLDKKILNERLQQENLIYPKVSRALRWRILLVRRVIQNSEAALEKHVSYSINCATRFRRGRSIAT